MLHSNKPFDLLRIAAACFLLSMLGVPSVLAQDEAPAVVAQAPEVDKKPIGHIVDGPANLRDFEPKDTGTLAIPADQIDLRKVFEDLGPDATLWYQHVQTLANPFFEGRAPGTHGIEMAAEYIEYYFKSYGLEPAFPEATEKLGGKEVTMPAGYRQRFDFASPSPKVNVLSSAMLIGEETLEADKDFTVLGISGSGLIVAPLTFVGYGFEKGKDDYTSFDEATDLSGRIAVVFRYEPLDDEGHSLWSETRFSRFAALAPKFKAIADRNAAGVILVNPPGAKEGKDGLESVKDSARFGDRMMIPVVQVMPEVMDKLITKADPKHRDLMTWRKRADNAEVTSVNLSDDVLITLNSQLEVDDRLITDNVGGIIRGKGDLADQWIIIGAHYDHVGTGYTGARQGNVGKIHPGADDNASGTAGVLIAAKRLMRDYEQAGKDAHLRSILLTTFSAEEAGLFGSKYMAKHLPMPTEKVDLMINMDMIGRLRSDNLLVQGLGTGDGMEQMFQKQFESSGLTISKTPGGRGPSDHSSFFAVGIPVLFMFTGEHAEYHQPTDRAYTVNPVGAIKVIDLLESITMDVAARPERMKFVNNTQGGAAGRAGTGRVRFGIQPDYSAQLETGVKVEAVSDNTSAAEAGIQSGDVLLTWNDEELTGGQKLMEMISKSEPGQKIKMTLVRGDKDVTIDVTLKAREQTE